MGKYDVNIDLANETKKEMAKVINVGQNRKVLNKLGAFASLYDFKFEEYEEPVLVLKTEEPGSKQLLAMEYGKIENVCYDMINHLVNDCIVMGATPLTVQDAIICGKLDKDVVTKIVYSIADACSLNGCVLTGGETSEQPGVLNDNVYILTSSIVGVVEKKNIVDGSLIKNGDVILALESSGIHTNGYTLVRSIIREKPEIMKEIVDGMSFIDNVLTPHRCYYNSLKGLFGLDVIHGMAHITGGGICENLNRILPCDKNAKIDLNAYKIPNIFRVLKKYGNISNEEMLRTFNLGVGMTVVTSKEHAEKVKDYLNDNGVRTYCIGEIVDGIGKVECDGFLQF